MSDPPVRVTLLTDFGTRDGYAAAMRGVIASIAPHAIIEDATHDIPPGDVLAAAIALDRYRLLYPPGTVHVAVVDPGVGTARRALALAAEDRSYIAPDNGLLTFVLGAGTARPHEIRAPAFLRHPVSATFHGRDVFAPAAAHLASGVAPDTLGPVVVHPVLLDVPAPVPGTGTISGTVLLADRFGNLITNIPGAAAPAQARVIVEGHGAVPLLRTYGDVTSGAVLALVGSSGRIEISVRDGDAAARLGIGRGTAVRVEPA